MVKTVWQHWERRNIYEFEKTETLTAFFLKFLGSKSSVVPPSFIKTPNDTAHAHSDTDDEEDDYIIPNAHSPPMASRLTIGSRERSKSESKLLDTGIR